MNFYHVEGHHVGDEEMISGIVCDGKYVAHQKYNGRSHKEIADDILFWDVKEEDIISSINSGRPLYEHDFIVVDYYEIEFD